MSIQMGMGTHTMGTRILIQTEQLWEASSHWASQAGSSRVLMQ